MVQENEIIMLILGLGVLLFLLGNRSRIKRFPSSNYLVLAFYLLLTGWILTVLEGFFLTDLLNFCEHASYALSSLSLTTWCWRVFGSGRESA